MMPVKFVLLVSELMLTMKKTLADSSDCASWMPFYFLRFLRNLREIDLIGYRNGYSY